MGLVTATVPALMLIASPDGNEIATFFGEIECEMSQTAKNVVLSLAISALILIAARMIRAARLFPELGLNAREMIRTVVISVLSMTGVEDAEVVYERDCECASGIISKYNQCWICSKEKHVEIKYRQKINRAFQTNFGGCKSTHSYPELGIRLKGWAEIYSQRDEEIACWEPEHDGHLQQREAAAKNVSLCKSMMGI